MKFFILFFAAGLLGAASSIEKGHIVGGYVCRKHSVPWQAFLSSKNSFCGGSLINKWWVLTAAHCCVTVNGTRVLLGWNDISKNEINGQEVAAARVIPHPNYNCGTFNNDIMLIKLARPAQINKYVHPIKLPTRCTAAPRTKCLVSGWGSINPRTDEIPRLLQCLNVPILSLEICRKAYSGITNNMICAGFVKGGKSFCWGDSGGPLVCNGFLQGIVSFGPESCAMKGYPGFYTKVCNYISWINKMMSLY